MQGSLYPNGVLVDNSALKRTEITKANEILRDRISLSSRGVYSGGEITINGVDDTKIDIAQLSGFCPNGEYIETTSNYLSLALSDYTLNAINYICVVYTENNTHSQPHESENNTYATYSEMYWRIRIYEESVYNALNVTDNNLSNDAKDRIIIMGKVSANGAGQPITISDIISPTVFSNVLYANPSVLSSITGVSIINVSSDTSIGVGSLSYTYTSGPPTYTFTWTSFAGGAGAPVVVTGDGYYNFADGASEYLRCYVVLSQLPTTGTFPVVESIEIINLYYQEVSRQTAEDGFHRNMIGSGKVSPQNPHGTSIEDVTGDLIPIVEEHQDVMHCNGIWRNSSSGIMQGSVSTATPTADTLNIQVPAVGDLYYVNGKKLNSISSSSILFNPWIWGVGYDLVSNFFEIYVDSVGTPAANRKASYPVSRDLRGTWIVDMSENYPAGSYNLTFQVSGLYTQLRWDGGSWVSFLTTDFGTTDGRIVRLYDGYGDNWIDLWINFDDSKHASDDDKFNSLLGPRIDSITVESSPSWDNNMQIASLCYWYDVTVPKGKLGYAPNELTRRVLDKRIFGNLCEDEMADKALQNMIYHQQDEMHESGVLWNRRGDGIEFMRTALWGLDYVITGGDYYCRGNRINAESDTITLVDNTINLIWLDENGSYNVIDITADFGGDLQLAMRYVLGGSIYIPSIDDDTHYSDDDDPPERGIILWEVTTSGGSVTLEKNVMRNVNGPVDPWSVGQRNTSGNLAAFNSLYSAFEYAKFVIGSSTRGPRRTRNIDIKIVGYNSIDDASVVQPQGVNVYGNIDSDGGHVEVNHIDIYGAWVLSQGCKVSGVEITNTVIGTTVFGLANSLVSSSNNVVIENCKMDVGTGSLTGFCIIGSPGFLGSSLDGVTIRNNYAEMDGGFLITYSTLALPVENMNILENTIKGGLAFSEVIELDSNAGLLSNINIKNNTMYGSTNIIINNALGCDISGNSIYVGRNTNGIAYGIDADDLVNSVISGNTILEYSGSSSFKTRGISVSNMTRCNISDNTIEGLTRGIINEDGGSFTDVVISDNVIDVIMEDAAAGGLGIFVSGSGIVVCGNLVTSEGVGIYLVNPVKSKISNNVVNFTTKSDGGTSLGSIGINVYQGDDVSVVGNDIYIISDGGVFLNSTIGIYINATDKFTVQSCKTISNGTSIGGGGSGQHIKANIGASSGNFSIKDCHVDNRTLASGGTSPLAGILVSGGGAGTPDISGYIGGNHVDGSNPNAGSINEFEITPGAGAIFIIGSNCIFDLNSGVSYPKINIGGAVISKGDNYRINNAGGTSTF